MSSEKLPAMEARSFEDLKRTNEHGAEYWSARDLQPLLGYSQWRRFTDAIGRAIEPCKTSGNNPKHHFADAGKMVELGSGCQRDLDDSHLSRFACNLIAQNGDQLAREGIKGEQKAIHTHEAVGREAREAIKRIGGTLPEQFPPDEHIKQVEKRVKSATPRLALDDKDAAGLLGRDGIDE